jgi:distribution and morphology protein 12
MSLPLTLSVTGFVMKAGLILALEGECRRAHLCLVEEDDDEDTEEALSPPHQQPALPGFVSPSQTYLPEYAHPRAKKPTPGMSILPSLSFESEVGQHDKHVLKNVGKVEKFIGEVLRKGLEDELVFPNYYTIDLPEPRS